MMIQWKLMILMLINFIRRKIRQKYFSLNILYKKIMNAKPLRIRFNKVDL